MAIRETGQWRIAALGTDITTHDLSAQGWKADKIDNSTATKEIATGAVKRARDALMFGLAGQGVSMAKDMGLAIRN